jgi:hypothetical protein
MLHGSQASQRSGPWAGLAARGTVGRLQGYTPPRSGRSRRSAKLSSENGGSNPLQWSPAACKRLATSFYLHAISAKPIEIASDLECSRTIAPGVQAPDQDSDRLTHRQKQPRCCSGLSWLRGRSQCAKSMAGKASAKRLPLRSLTSPHDQLISPCWRSRQTKFQPKSREHPRSGR